MDQSGALRATTYTQKSGLSGNALKTIAIFAMLVDHIAAVFVPNDSPLYTVMRFIGRFTAPVLFFFIAEGYHRTHNVNRYMLRLAVFAAISYVPYIYCFYGALPNADNFYHFDVIFTLFLGLLAIRARHELKSPVAKVFAIAAILVLSATSDWYYMGIIYILLFDYFYGDFKKQAFAYCLVTLAYVLPGLLPPLISWIPVPGGFANLSAYAGGLYRLGLFIPILLLGKYNGRKGGGGAFAKWAFYVFYPAHLLILGLIHQFL